MNNAGSMNSLEGFKSPHLAQRVAEQIARLSKRPIRIMEVCGTHTVAIFRSGLRALLPPQVELVSGPGCPVCVTSEGELAQALELARQPDVILASFGDLLRIPTRSGSLEQARSTGASVATVYSPIEALELARCHPDQQVAFFALGFETTAPAIAATILAAAGAGLENFSVISGHKLIPPAMRSLLASRRTNIHGFLCPGHVSAIIGSAPYNFIAQEFHLPAVISGFEPLDILASILSLVEQHESRTARVEIQYGRAVRPGGNPQARRLMQSVFQPCAAQWRGLGMIPESGLELRREWAGFDARKRFSLQDSYTEEPEGCACGQVLQGIIPPPECPLFSHICNPEQPQGPCMVSSEGSCAAYYKYGRLHAAIG